VNDSAGNAAIQVIRTVTVTAEQANSSLDHYWKLDETSGSPYLDTYLGANGTCTGAACPVPVNGQVAGAQSFDGNDEIDVIETANFNWAANDSFSIAFWIKTDIYTVHDKNNVMIGQKSSSNPTHLAWFVAVDRLNNGKIMFGLNDGNDGGHTLTRGNTPVKDDVWHHIVCVRDGVNNENRIYVDGLLDAVKSKTYDADFNEGTEPLNIGYLDWDWGSHTGGYHYQGLLDEIAVFNTALSSAEIQQHYSDGLDRNGL
jgi:hypothetical protein